MTIIPTNIFLDFCNNKLGHSAKNQEYHRPNQSNLLINPFSNLYRYSDKQLKSEEVEGLEKKKNFSLIEKTASSTCGLWSKLDHYKMGVEARIRPESLVPKNFPLNKNNSNDGNGHNNNNNNDTDNYTIIQDDAMEYMVSIPEDNDENRGFNFSKLWAFTGPGFLMSIAYLDPGNIESDLQSGTIAKYKLLWVLLSAHILGLFLQRLSSRLGVVSNKNMAEMAYEYYPTAPRLFLWVMIEIAIIGSDMQEVIGTAIAFTLLSNGAIPLFLGVLITMIDTFTFLFVDRYGFRKLEVIFAVLISTMALSFGYEFFIVKPDGSDILQGMIIPWCSDCGRREFLQAVSIVGAVIMPHNLYLHSALVKSRRIDRRKKTAIKDANYYYFIESGIALLCSFIINLFVVSVFAHGLYRKTNADVFQMCANNNHIPQFVFPNNTNEIEADIYRSGIFLGCKFGLASLYVWGLGIMAAGQSSTMTGTYSGQFVMEGFLKIQWPRWRRVFVTRLIAIVPTIIVALMANGVENLTGMNDLLNCIQMIQLPFALLPIITFTSRYKIMFEFKNSRVVQWIAIFISSIVISINLYFSSDYIFESLGYKWYTWIFLSVLGCIYISFLIYLAIICLHAMDVKWKTFQIFYSTLLCNDENEASVSPPFT